MSPTYLVQMPRAEARHLAGITPATWPALPETRVIHAIREWVTGIARRPTATVPVCKVVADLTAILDTLSATPRPVRGPFATPGNRTPPLAGRVEYLGGGIVRLDQEAITSLAQLPPDQDFHVTCTAAGPVLTVGADTYPAREEEPDIKPPPATAPATP